jgi:hypothetical protein
MISLAGGFDDINTSFNPVAHLSGGAIDRAGAIVDGRVNSIEYRKRHDYSADEE